MTTTQALAANTISPLYAVEPPASSCCSWDCRHTVILAGTLVAITGLVISILSSQIIFTACFAVLTAVNLFALVVMIKSMNAEEQNEVERRNIATLEQQLQKEQAETQALQRQNETLTQTSQVLETNLNAQKQLTAQQTLNVQNLAGELNQFKQNNRALRTIVDQLNTEKVDREKTLLAVQTELELAKLTETQLHASSNALAGDVTRLSAENTQLETTVAEITAALTSEKQETAALQDTLKQQQVLTETIQKELEQLKAVTASTSSSSSSPSAASLTQAINDNTDELKRDEKALAEAAAASNASVELLQKIYRALETKKATAAAPSHQTPKP